MHDSKTDLQRFLIYFVKYKTEDEIHFQAELDKCQLKCIIRNHHKYRGNEDCLLIHTKLTENNVLKSDDKNLGGCDVFYIKSQNVSHRADKNIQNGIMMSIQTIVTRESSMFEIVFNTAIFRENNGEDVKKQTSFIREKLESGHPSTEEINEFNEGERNSNNINNMVAKNGVDESSKLETSKNENSSPQNDNNNKMDKRKNKSILRKLNFKSRKKKSQDKMQQIRSSDSDKSPIFSPTVTSTESFELVPDSTSSDSPFLSSPESVSPNKNLLMRTFSSEDFDMKERPRNIFAKISVQEQKSEFQIDDDIVYMDEEEEDEESNISPMKCRAISVTSLCCDFSFNIMPDISEEAEKDHKHKKNLCNCTESRYDLIAAFFLEIPNKKSLKKEDSNRHNYFISEFEKYDKSTMHLKDCEHQEIIRKDSDLSVSSFDFTPDDYSSKTEFFDNSGTMKTVPSFPDLSTALLDGDVPFTLKHVNYFMKLKSYMDYKVAMKKLCPPELSPKALPIFFVITRKLIKHFGGLECSDDANVIKLMKFSKRYVLNASEEQKLALMEIFQLIEEDDD